jgi:site-specific recombinase XerD
MTDSNGLTISQALPGWRLRLRAAQKADLTVSRYLKAATALDRWLTSEDLPTDVGTITRATIEAYFTHLIDAGAAPATQAMAYKCLRQFFNYLLDDEEISRHPMAKVRQPKVEDPVVEVLPDADLAKMVATCATNSFVDRRDAAVLRVLMDAGTRRTETTTMTLPGIDLEAGTIEVMGKGRKPRTVVIGDATAAALDRYLRARARHAWAGKTDRLWLGQRGPMGDDGVASIVAKRAAMAGLGHVHPHQLRHTWASQMKEANMQPDELKLLAGWSTDAMLQRYGRATVTRRAIASGRKASVVDRLARTR